MQVSVSLEFLVDGAVDHRVDIVPEEHQLSGANDVHEEARTSNTSFQYSGRHDGGALPKLREGGPHDRMLYAIRVCGVRVRSLFGLLGHCSQVQWLGRWVWPGQCAGSKESER